MHHQKQRRRIRNLLVMPLFQGRIVLLVVFAGLACTAVVGYLYYSYIVDTYNLILRHSTLPLDLEDQRYGDLIRFGVSLGLATLLANGAIAIWGLVATHRSAGAIYHLQMVIWEIKRGDLNARIQLRKSDDFQDLANSFNVMMDQLQTMITISTNIEVSNGTDKR